MIKVAFPINKVRMDCSIYIVKIIAYLEINQLDPPLHSEIRMHLRRVNLLMYKQKL